MRKPATKNLNQVEQSCTHDLLAAVLPTFVMKPMSNSSQTTGRRRRFTDQRRCLGGQSGPFRDARRPAAFI
ncbi:hypothetical protein I41_45260 [Lacipirellula limnantheis]|uniref:Uncharacterized protein n=1 Tax=Lacipirellula limnantheis TaxID=2528024 RepID=A0A517U3W7_9BACT|nr:hypothetical protein I41_45260 [Lacipirellula limnantheis]